jgi:hypothetical protein
VHDDVDQHHARLETAGNPREPCAEPVVSGPRRGHFGTQSRYASRSSACRRRAAEPSVDMCLRTLVGVRILPAAMLFVGGSAALEIGAGDFSPGFFGGIRFFR